VVRVILVSCNAGSQVVNIHGEECNGKVGTINWEWNQCIWNLHSIVKDLKANLLYACGCVITELEKAVIIGLAVKDDKSSGTV